MSIEHLCIITQEYPTPTQSIYPFVDQLARALCDTGVQVTVIAPLSVTKRLMDGLEMPPLESVRRTNRGREIKVYRPRYVSLSDSLLGVNTAMLTYKAFRRAVLQEMRRRKLKPDALYGHFIAMSGLCASELGTIFNIPAFLGYGESSPDKFAMFDHAFVKEKLAALSGIISVSTENKRRLLALGYVENPETVSVFPNGIDVQKFRPMDRMEARRTLGFDGQAFIVAFVGSFIQRKGVGLLSEALDMMPDIKAVFIGSGGLKPTCKNILFEGQLISDEIPRYLSAADVFVLPTLNEGSCNALIEAMGCGLPIVSSNLPFNDDILNDENSLRVDPADAKDIRRAICALKEDGALRGRLAQGALATARELNIDMRARNILQYMEQRIKRGGRDE